MSLIHDSLRRLESKQVNKIVTDSNTSTDYVDTTNKSLLNKSWVIGLLVFAVLATIFTIISTKDNGFNSQELAKIEPLEVSSGLIESKSENQINKNLPIVNEKVNIPVAVTLQPLVEVQEVKTHLTEVSKPTTDITSHKIDEISEVDLAQIIPTKINQPKKSAIVKKKPQLLSNKVRRAKTKNNSKLTVKETRQLVNNLQMYIEEKNQDKVESLLWQLQNSSGVNSLVYLRMHAYWSSLQKDDATAVRMYKKILFQKPNDIQAGTNLALIEARQDNIVQAVNRLKALQKYYPADKNIEDYIKRLEVMK
jgi:hypothetical protein